MQTRREMLGKSATVAALLASAGMLPLHEAVPLARVSLTAVDFQAWKRHLVTELARLAAELHRRRAFHKDLYLCHFMGRIEGAVVEIRLIDTARVSPLPRLFARRWIVKDLAQFVFGAKASGVSDSQCGAWLEAYGNLRKIDRLPALKKSVHQKCAWIARHDKRLNQKQPHRNISIP